MKSTRSTRCQGLICSALALVFILAVALPASPGPQGGSNNKIRGNGARSSAAHGPGGVDIPPAAVVLKP